MFNSPAYCGWRMQERRAAMPSPLAPRQRKAVKYTEDTPGRSHMDHDGSATMDTDDDGSSSDDSSGSELQAEKVRLCITSCLHTIRAAT